MILALDRRRPLAEQLYDEIGRRIREGELAPGDRLPASRRLAAEIGVGRNTVVAAYQQLAAEGYLETAGAGGTRVSRDLPVRPLRFVGAPATSRRRGRISAEARRIVKHGAIFAPVTIAERRLRWNFDFNANVSDAAARRAWARILRRTAARYEDRAAPFDFSRRPGPLHEALVRHLLLTRGVRCDPRRIVVLSSGHQAMHLAVRLLLEPGDGAAVEDPHYLGIRNALRARGARLLPVGVDRQGLLVDRLPRRPGAARMVYTTPSCQLPTGVVMPLARRLALLDWARRHDAWILENDHNSEYRYEGPPVPSIQGLDESERTLYVGGLSRLFSPPLAIGYLVVPLPLEEPFRAATLLEGIAPSRLEQEAMAEFLVSGEMEKLLRRVWRRTRGQRRRLRDALARLGEPSLEVQRSSGGLHLHVRLRGWTVAAVDRLVRFAEELDVGVSPDAPYHLRRARHPGLLLGFANLEPEELSEGVRRFGVALRRACPPRLRRRSTPPGSDRRSPRGTAS